MVHSVEFILVPEDQHLVEQRLRVHGIRVLNGDLSCSGLIIPWES